MKRTFIGYSFFLFFCFINSSFAQSLMECGNTETVINRDNLPSGIYFYKIYNTQGTIGQGKLIIK